MLQLHLVVHYEEWSALNVCLMDVTAEQSVSPYLLWGVLCEGTTGSLWFGFGSFTETKATTTRTDLLMCWRSVAHAARTSHC